MAKIVTVYNTWDKKFVLSDMSNIRWLKISEALARLGHQVDIATAEDRSWWRKHSPITMGSNLRRVPVASVRWGDYDIVKTLFHTGFETLELFGGASHPFIISKLGSVVGPKDMDGVYFYGGIREQLYATQKRIEQSSRYVTLLSKPAQRLWTDCFGAKDNLLIVPGGVDRNIPGPGTDPFPTRKKPRCIFAGNVYITQAQPEANQVLIDKLNELGKQLGQQGVGLYLLGSGDVTRLDQKFVTYLGSVSYEKSWNYLQHSDVGVVLAAGNHTHHNESSKIYHYLRAGLPVVSEAGFPNDHVVGDSKLGHVVGSGNLEMMARKIIETIERKWDTERGVGYVLENHTWDQRVQVYDRVIKTFTIEAPHG